MSRRTLTRVKRLLLAIVVGISGAMSLTHAFAATREAKPAPPHRGVIELRRPLQHPLPIDLPSPAPPRIHAGRLPRLINPEGRPVDLPEALGEQVSQLP
jgi:hypothetical protein